MDDAAAGQHWLVHPFRFVARHPERVRLNWENVAARWIDPSELAEPTTVPRLAEVWQRVAGAGESEMPVSDAVTERIAAIAGDEINGASYLAREALRTIGLCAQTAPERDVAGLLDRVRACADQLATARPEMVSVHVWVARLLRALEASTSERLDADAARLAMVQQAEDFIARSVEASERTARNAAELLSPGCIVFTASYSQTVRDACRLAARDGRLGRLLMTESADAKGHSHGRLLAEAVATAGIAAEVIADAEAPDRVAEADVLWLGADTVLEDGSILNGSPSLAVAAAARAAGRPVQVICESAKLVSELTRLGVPSARVPTTAPPGMDRVPAELITSLVTEHGVSEAGSPESLVARIASQLLARQETLAVIESAAGGRMSDLLTDRPGSSGWYAGGAVAYSHLSKQRVAGLTAEQLQALGAVSAETAQGMAEGARRFFGSTWGIGETGIAGPQTGRRSAKPAGLVYLALSGPTGPVRVREITTGVDDRRANKQAFALAALRLLLSALESPADS